MPCPSYHPLHLAHTPTIIAPYTVTHHVASFSQHIPARKWAEEGSSSKQPLRMKTPRVLPKCNLSTTHVHFWILMEKRENKSRTMSFSPSFSNHHATFSGRRQYFSNQEEEKEEEKKKQTRKKKEYGNARRENLCAETHTFFACPPCVCTLFYSISLAGPRITLSCFDAACARAKPFFGRSWW